MQTGNNGYPKLFYRNNALGDIIDHSTPVKKGSKSFDVVDSRKSKKFLFSRLDHSNLPAFNNVIKEIHFPFILSIACFLYGKGKNLSNKSWSLTKSIQLISDRFLIKHKLIICLFFHMLLFWVVINRRIRYHFFLTHYLIFELCN